MAIGAIFAQSVALADPADVFMRKGNQLYEQATHGKELDEQKLKESIEAYQEALRRNPTPLIKYNLGTAQARLRQYQEAQQTLTEATESPDVGVKQNSNFNLGIAKAKPLLDEIRSGQLKPDGKNLKKLEETLQSFRNVILGAPNDIDAIYNYEVTKKAYDAIKKELQNQPQNSGDKGEEGNSGKGNAKGSSDQSDPSGKQSKQDQKQGQQGQNQQGNQDQQKQDQQGKQDQKQDQKQGQDPKQGQDNKEQKGQNQGGLEDQKRGDQKQDKPESSQQQPAGGEEGKATKPLNPDQMDAMRLLNLLEKEKPQQYKRLFQFRGETERKLQKDW
ncbi:hypothetical protein LLG95_01190 [bacterium]|nr:hypothetical protein [bacterium]